MSKWEMVKLGDVCNLNMGQSPDSSSYNQEGDGIPFYQGNADFGDLHPVTRFHCSQPTKIARKGDILISVRAPIGAINIATEPCCIGRGLAALTAKADQLDTKYLYYVLSYKNRELNSKGTGSTFKAISKQTLSEVKLPLSPLETQRTIAKTLDTVSEILAMRKQQLAELDNLIKSTFYDIFGDPVINEKDWTTSLLGEICENLDGKRIPISSSFREKGIYPYYGASGVVDYVGDYIFDGTYLLVSEDGANLLARTTPIAFSVSGKIWVNNHAHILQFDYYPLQLYIENVINNMDISSYVTGSAQPKLNQAKLNSLVIPIPPKELLIKFSEIKALNQKQRELIMIALGDAQILFDSLMSRYFD